ncbi:BEN domain-containing protein 7 [Chanos chanos]|uniref:BEN domain-containing protein 7 n=1 Tax=Chanos chanos TaxID=29144 RepID=A0A6J2WNY6_CHACN|nr:BEN domain-containing protein 7 [Chanos chanos]
MEFVERRRSRKSQSFKLINDQAFEPEYSDSGDHSDVNGEPVNTAVGGAWLGDDGLEIKRQITGMMRLLNDKAGRVYQRVGREEESLKQEVQEEALGWASPAGLFPEDPHPSTWSSEPTQLTPQYGTRSRTQKNHGKAHDMPSPPTPVAMVTEPPCCMCNCKSTLQAILLELRTVRKLLQTNRGVQEKQVAQVNTGNSRCRKRARKRRPIRRVTALTPPTKRNTPPSPPPEAEHSEVIGRRERLPRDKTVTALPVTPISNPTPTAEAPPPQYSLMRGQSSAEAEVRLAEDYEVFIPRAQLDSILLNYTRSGSLLFRKLVCAFFDDTTLANSLPNGKRKRGVNDQRKGLDQNIVGAIKVFTEKYCMANRIQKLPGPRDWVQILQDQIKLARRRLKRAETATDCEETGKRTRTDKTDGACDRVDSLLAVENP